MGLTSDNYPCVAYYDATNGDLRYTQKSGSGWTVTDAVDTVGNVGDHCVLVMDSLSNPRVAYHDITNGGLKYAAKRSGSWGTVFADPGSTRGTGISMTLVTIGSPRIAYYDTSGGDLWFAWADSVVPGGGGGGEGEDGGGYEMDPAIDLQTTNPMSSNGVLTLAIRMPGSAEVRIGLYDLSGRRVADRGSERLAAGHHRLQWSPGVVPPGLYFVRAMVGNQAALERRIVVLK